MLSGCLVHSLNGFCPEIVADGLGVLLRDVDDYAGVGLQGVGKVLVR